MKNQQRTPTPNENSEVTREFNEFAKKWRDGTLPLRDLNGWVDCLNEILKLGDKLAKCENEERIPKSREGGWSWGLKVLRKRGEHQSLDDFKYIEDSMTSSHGKLKTLWYTSRLFLRHVKKARP